MTTEELFSFIENSPTAFHAIEAMRCRLKAEGYQPLLEGSDWNLQAGGKYYVIRNGSSIIAFRIPAKEWKGFQIMASHSDSPMFKIKENPEIEAEGHYVKLNVEKYGGMLCAPWFDRPLSVAGRLVVKDGEQIVTKLVMPTTAFRLIRRKSSFLCMEMKTQKEPLWNEWQHLPVLPGKIFWHTIFMYTAGLPVLYGVLRENIFPAVVWTICSVHSRHWKVSYRHRTEKVFRFTVSLTMKKWEVPASRGLLLHCFAIR